MDEVLSPNYEVPSLREIREFTGRAIAAARKYESQSPCRDHSNLEIVEAATARIAALMDGTMALEEAGCANVIGVVLRTVYEVWLIGMYAFLGSDEVKTRLVDQYHFELRYLIDNIGGDLSGIPLGAEFKIWSFAAEVRRFQASYEHPQATYSVDAYNVLYRYESLFSVHAGLGSIGLRVSEHDRQAILKAPPTPDERSRHQFLLGATMSLSLARALAVCKGLNYSDTDDLEKWVINLRTAE